MRMAGPILLGDIASIDDDRVDRTAWHHLPRHKDEDQVRLDVDRSFIYYPKSPYHLTAQPHEPALGNQLHR